MIEWDDEGAVLAVRKYGETSVIADIFTSKHGRHAGIVRGGIGRKLRPALQPGSQISISWRARLEDQLGTFTIEPLRSRSAAAMGDKLALAGLNAVTALLATTLPERDPHPALYAKTIQLLDLLGHSSIWPLAYLNWEMALLDDMGFGLELGACAVSGANDRLIYISPKSGRAVAESAAGAWADRMLPLPDVMRGEGDATNTEIARALGTTGHFVENRLYRSLGGPKVPAARARLIDVLKSYSA